MTLLAVERIKLLSTRSPYWCVGSALAASLIFSTLFAVLFNAFPPDTAMAEPGNTMMVYLSQSGLGMSQLIFLVLGVLTVTTEYRFNTMRASFVAIPHRAAVLLAKTVVMIIVGALTALVASLGSFLLVKMIISDPNLTPALREAVDWRLVFGHAALFAIAAVLAVAVGTLIRHSAGAIAILLVWAMILGGIISVLPKVKVVAPWLPFNAANTFVTPDISEIMGGMGGGGPFGSSVVDSAGPSPVGGLLIFAGTAVVLWIIALVTLLRRDA